MKGSTIEGIPLLVHKSWAKSSMVNGHILSRRNIWVVLAYFEDFFTMNSRKVTAVQLADGLFVGQKRHDNATEEAELLADNPKEFLLQTIGTADKRTKKYKAFVKTCDNYKAYIMKRRMQRVNSNENS
jgi:hypothetical protein